MPSKHKKMPVPRFTSPDDERAWFEEHASEVDGTDLDENPFVGHARKVAYSLRLDAGDVERLEKAASRRGVRPTQLARRWLIEQLAAVVEDEGDPAERVASVSAELRDAASRLDRLRWTPPALQALEDAMEPFRRWSEQQRVAMEPLRRWSEQHSAVIDSIIRPVAEHQRAAIDSLLAPISEQWRAVFAELGEVLSARLASEQVAAAAVAASARERPGAAVFEFVSALRPELADEVRGTDADPSEDDTKVAAFFERVAQLAAAA